MTVQEYIDKVKNMSPDEQQASADAILAILASRNAVSEGSAAGASSGFSTRAQAAIQKQSDPDLLTPTSSGRVKGSVKSNATDDDDDDGFGPDGEDDSQENSEEDDNTGATEPDSSDDSETDDEASTDTSDEDEEEDEEDDSFEDVEADYDKDEDEWEDYVDYPEEDEDEEEDSEWEDYEDVPDEENDDEEIDDDEVDFQDHELDQDLVKRQATQARTLDLAQRTKAWGEKHAASVEALKELDTGIEKLKSIGKSQLQSMSDTDFNKVINDTLDACDKVRHVSYSTDIEARVKQIQNDRDSGTMSIDLNAEDNQNTAAARSALQARSSENAKYAGKSMTDFKFNLYRTIRDQIEYSQQEEQSYSRLNKRSEDTGTLKPGSRLTNKLNDEIPSLYVYFDQSGSWGTDEVNKGIQAMRVLADFEQKKELTLKIYYFANYLGTTPEGLGGGTSAWEEIIQNIKANNAKNVVLMTDTDMAYLAEKGSGAVVPGCVYFIWKNSQSACPEIVKKLKGKQGNYQYHLS